MTLFSCSQERLFDSVSIALIGKYTDLKDSYMSVIKALEHSAFRCHRKLILHVCPVLYFVMKYYITTILYMLVGGIIGSGTRTTGGRS
jgi:CTP synthase (UTP-ammonia lyase)